ncbi:MAG: NAD-binding protein [Desulfarculus sp.]|nr:NAD-binding protein [Pseudomonadota bacterium]MBV1717739.1 NAD-binding protein [Desulfarculus sp.]MBU4576747.1 NAD-binding protein [Pseudomonadota bacterium]MBU4596736.1 NAD-binding protein [Pseudomonadota bacterium]MBV1740495.1 NAD-binding protein [Desulfarculus sp.]
MNQKRKIMICGATPVSHELLKRLSGRWEPTLVGQSKENLERAHAAYAGELTTFEGDPSSPVVLEQAGLAQQQYVAALAEDDAVNLAVAQAARQAGVAQILAVYYRAAGQARFNELGVEALLASAALARELNHFLEDPDLLVTPLGLGRGAVMELEADSLPHLVGRRVDSVRGDKWRLVALVREQRLLLPDPHTRIQPGDHLLLMGPSDAYGDVCSQLECGLPGFPLSWGHTLLVVLNPKNPDEHEGLMNEALAWALNSQVSDTTILCREDLCDLQSLLNEWPAASQVRVETVASGLLERARELCAQGEVGLVVMGKFEPTMLGSLAKSALMNLAESLGAPLVLAGGTLPYQKILVPFNGRASSLAALEVAAEVARQTGGEVSLAMVEEPEFVRGEDSGPWVEQVLAKAREQAHIHKLPINEVVLRGNPVHEIRKLSSDYDLLVVGGSSRGRGLLSPNVGEHLAAKAGCSVLVVAKED